MEKPTLAVIIPVLLAAGLAACGGDDIEVYRIAKSPSQSAFSRPGGGRAPASGPAGLRWKTPGDWRELPGAGMRKATFKIGKAEMSVVSLPGRAGGALLNINRWRGQIGLEPLSEEQLAGVTESVPTGVGDSIVVDFPGAGGVRLLAAIIEWGGQSWFFKMTGPGAQVGKAKPAFREFLTNLNEDR